MNDLEIIKQNLLKLAKDYYCIKNKKIEFVPGKSIIPPSGKLIDHEEIEAIIESALDGWLTAGRYNDQFEKKLASFLGTKFLLTTNSGSSANLLAFYALTSEKLGSRSIQPGDEVITVAAGFPTTVNPILQYGAIPVFVDINIETHNIDVSKLDEALSKKTKAVMIAHSLGNPFDLKTIKKFCEENKLWLIEDSCDALGSKYDGKMVGTFGDIGTLSFYPAHHITMGEGGAIFTDNFLLKKIIESFRDWGRDCFCAPGKDNTCGKRYGWKLGNLPFGYDHKYTYSHAGFNLKITDMQAACGLAQLNKLEKFIEIRKKNFNFLSESLSSCEKLIFLPKASPRSDPSWFGFLITLKEEANVDRLTMINFLNQRGIGTRLLFAGNLIDQPYMKNKKFRISGDLKNTEYIMKNSFWIGVYPGLSEEMLRYVVESIEFFLGVNF